MRVRLRPAIAADVAQFAEGQPLPHRIRAIAAVSDDGRLLGLGGLGYRPDGTVIAFAHITDEGRKYPAAIHRAGRAAVAMMRASGVPLVTAEAQDGNPAAVRWLKRLGFEPCGDVFVWRRGSHVE